MVIRIAKEDLDNLIKASNQLKEHARKSLMPLSTVDALKARGLSEAITFYMDIRDDILLRIKRV